MEFYYKISQNAMPKSQEMIAFYEVRVNKGVLRGTGKGKGQW